MSSYGAHHHLRRKRRKRAIALGKRLTAMSLWMTFTATALDALQGQWIFVASNLIGALGIYISHHQGHRGRWGSDFIWPAFAGVFVCSLVAIHLTGDISSPFLGTYLVLLTATGVVLQTRFRRRTVIKATVGYFLFWVALSIFEPNSGYSSANFTTFFLIEKHVILLAGILISLLHFIRVQDELSHEAANQLRALNEAQLHLAHTSKMAEMGDLVATTAHELTQPVQVIHSASALLKKRLEDAEPGTEPTTRTRQLALRVHESAERLIPLLLQFRNFSRKEPFKPTAMDLREAVRGLRTITQYDLRINQVRYEVDLPGTPIWVNGDSMRLQQILLNLVNNARDACRDVKKPSISIRVDQSNGRARLFVENNGPPIPPEVQPRLFEPYFTTKSKNKGTGLGLAICERLVRQHHGRMFFSSAPETTVFVVDLPAASQPGSIQTA
ncbi:MAG: sensor histidine kinase [Bdellovibrionota bacterium]